MARSPLVTNVLENHTTITVGDDKLIRRSFYKTLGRLLFGGAQMSNFHAFVMPWQKQLEQIKVKLLSIEINNRVLLPLGVMYQELKRL
jgi:hypothetical protein